MTDERRVREFCLREKTTPTGDYEAVLAIPAKDCPEFVSKEKDLGFIRVIEFDAFEDLESKFKTVAHNAQVFADLNVKYETQLEQMNQNCISLNLHESRMKAQEQKIDKLLSGNGDLAVECLRLKEDLRLVRESQERQRQLNDAQSLELAKAREVIQSIAKADCPTYMAHPQSVWFDEHVLSKARAYLDLGSKNDNKNACD